MWLRELQIRNFRKIDELTVTFPRGLTVLVGENNSGKTTIIDALRLMLFSSWEFDSLRLTEDDFRAGTAHAAIEISCRFTGLEDEDEVHFQECLVDIGDGKFEMQGQCPHRIQRDDASVQREDVGRRNGRRLTSVEPFTTASRRSTCSRYVIPNAVCGLASIPKCPALSTA